MATKRKNPVMVDQRMIELAGKKYTRRAWADGWVQHYRENKRQACLVKLDVLTHAGLIARIDAMLASGESR